MTQEKSQADTTETKVVENKDGSIKITQPKDGHKQPKITVLMESDDLVRHQARGFVSFLQDYAVVGLALGFIVGQQANGVVKQLIASFVDPLFQVWFGQSLSTRVAIVHHHQAIVKIPWGAFVYVLIEFFFVLLLMYTLIKVFKLDRFAKKDVKKK